MSNTVIKLKKSSVSGEIPSSLEFGEIAINYADGLIYYRDHNDTIKHISSGANAFSTVSVNGTLLTAAVQSAILSINSGNNIELTPDFLNDAFTITANLKPAFDTANAAFDYANSVAIASNTAQVTSIMIQAYGTANAAFDKANAANVLAYNTGIGANNYAGFMANAANAYAASLTPDLSPVFIVANNAYDKANLALPAFTTGNLTFSQSIPLVGPNLSNTAGERIVIWPQRPNGAYYNYSIGLEHDAIWFGVDIGLSTTGFKWYTGNTKIMELARNANLTVSYINTDNIKFGDGTVQNSAFRYDILNVAFNVANSAFDYANGIGTYESASYGVANAAFDKANAANVLAYNTGISANAYTDTVGLSANNYAGAMANAANAYAASLTPDLTPVFTVTNAAFGVANSAYNYANGLSSLEAASYDTANSAYAVANAAFDKANTGTSIANANAFSIISVSGQDNVVASINDTLTLVAGNNINITTDSMAKSITISSFGLGYTDYGSIAEQLTSLHDYGSI